MRVCAPLLGEPAATELTRLCNEYEHLEAERDALKLSAQGWERDALIYAKNAGDWEQKCNALTLTNTDLTRRLKEAEGAIVLVKEYFATPTDHLYHVMFAAIYPPDKEKA